MKTYKTDPYYEDEPTRNFFIVMDVLKEFVDPSDNTIINPDVCATLLKTIEPIVRRSNVFSAYIGETFDPNDVIQCLTNVVYPDFVNAHGGHVSHRPSIAHTMPLPALPKDINRYDSVYRQVLEWVYERHENEMFEIVDTPVLHRTLSHFLPMLKAITVFDASFDGHDDNTVIDMLIDDRIENESVIRRVFDDYEDEQ